MCGIFGYLGAKEAVPIILEGLKRLEYRGYDSAGMAVLHNGNLNHRKAKGKIEDLERILKGPAIRGNIGIGHTRWATHGKATAENAHPHFDCSQQIAVVHNGIIENYEELKKKLTKNGHQFRSSTDTEVVAHLIEEGKAHGLLEALRKALLQIEGSYALAIISSLEPDKIFVARKGSPLIVGFKADEVYLASDVVPILKNTNKVIYLGEGEIGVLSAGGSRFFTLSGREINKKADFVSWDPTYAEKGGFATFMLKEIHEQPQVITETFKKYSTLNPFKIKFDGLNLPEFNRIVIVACGTSWHAGLVGKYWIEKLVRIPVEVDYAAEFRYRTPIVNDKTLIIPISQSGETADTLAAIAEARKWGAKVLSIVNVAGSSIARESDYTIYTLAGTEVGVASTKAFTTQLTVLYLLALYLACEIHSADQTYLANLLIDLYEIPQKIKSVIEREQEIADISTKYYKSTNALFLGRGLGYPIALEGALKLKEISYIHAEGYPAAEMKHGPIALIDHNMPVVTLAFKGRRYEKILGNIEEVNARGGKVIGIGTEGDLELKNKVADLISIPEVSNFASPILSVVPLQLLAYHIASKRGCPVDQPRNLAKSVTVE